MSDTFTDDDIKRALAICEAATPGPWHQSNECMWACVTTKPVGMGVTVLQAPDTSSTPMAKADAAFAAAARDGWPRALRALEAARHERDEWFWAANDWMLKYGQRDDRIAALEADLAAERAAHAETRERMDVMRKAMGLWSQANAEAQSGSYSGHEIAAAIDIERKALLATIGEREPTEAEVTEQMRKAFVREWTGRRIEKARAEALERVAALARHSRVCAIDDVAADSGCTAGCTCGLDAARKAAGLP